MGECKWHGVPLVEYEGRQVCILSAAILASRQAGKKAMDYLSWRAAGGEILTHPKEGI